MFTAQLVICLACVLCASCATLPTTPHQGCVMRGVHYQVGTFKPSHCEYCTCPQDGRPSCAIMECMFQPCVDAVHVPNECCPVCPNGRNCRHKDGTVIKDGEQYKPDPHTTCESQASMWGVDGTRALCVVDPPTPAPRPVCERNGANCKHSDGTIIKPGEQYKPDTNTTCECPQNVFGMRGRVALCVAQPLTPLTPVQLTTHTPLTPMTTLTA